MKIIVIGGVAGGATAAARLRRNDESAQIVLIERGPCISFANRGLPYHISGIIVLLSPRGEAIRPKLPGIDSKRVFVLRNIPDLDRIMAHLQTTNPCRAVVIAGGYIGIEMAENLHERGLSNTLVEGASYILAPFDDEMAAIVQAHIKDKTSSCT